jgi:hypothetical protein
LFKSASGWITAVLTTAVAISPLPSVLLRFDVEGRFSDGAFTVCAPWGSRRATRQIAGSESLTERGPLHIGIAVVVQRIIRDAIPLDLQ